MSEHKPRRILVTGGSGFIGRHLLRRLLAEPAVERVVNLDALTYAACRERCVAIEGSPRYRFVHGDIGDGPLLETLLRQEQIDSLLHLAAESHVDRSISGPAAFIQTNLVGTFTLLEAARRYLPSAPRPFRFHHVSTDEVYGSLAPSAPASREGDAYAPNSPYAASKAGSDHLVRAYGQTYGLPVLMSHASNNYGPGQHAEKFIPTVLRCALAGQSIPLYGDGGAERDWLHVTDHVEGLWRVLIRGQSGARYNLGGGNTLTNRDLALRLCRLLDEAQPAGAPHARLLRHVTDRPGHDRRYDLNSALAAAELGFKPAVDVEAGLRALVAEALAARGG